MEEYLKIRVFLVCSKIFYNLCITLLKISPIKLLQSLSLISSVYAQSSFNEQDLATPNNSQIEVTKLIDQTQK